MSVESIGARIEAIQSQIQALTGSQPAAAGFDQALASAAPGGLRAIFEVYRATFKNIEDDKKWAEQKLTMPVLAVGSQYFIGEENRRQMERVAENVRYVELDCGHSMALERPEKLARELHNFFKE